MSSPPGTAGGSIDALHDDASRDLVSIVIPCFGQAHYLVEALASLQRQSHAHWEAIVVDDGSPDDTSAVVARFAAHDARIRGFRQENRGLSGARNAGLRRARGRYVVFLDADDALLPDALAAGVRVLSDRPDCAMACGRFEFMNCLGEPIANELEIGRIDGDPYEALLRVNQLAVPAMVMYARWVLDALGAFDATTTPAEDYDLYLRIVRQHPIVPHAAMVARYRQHGEGLSADAARMGRAVLTVMDRQRPHVAGDRRLEAAWEAGVRFWKRFYFPRAARRALASLVWRGDWRPATRELAIVLRWGPLAIARYVPEKVGALRARRRTAASVAP